MHRWAVAAIIGLLLVGIWLYDSSQVARTQANLHSEALKDLSTLRANLEGTVNSTLQLTQGLIAFVATHPDLSREEFEAIARELMGKRSHIRNMTLVRGDRIAFVYPYEGNEAALGLDIFAHPVQGRTAHRAKEGGQTVVGGPYELVQGGRAFISRVPIYIAEGQPGAGEYWGLSSIPLDLDSVYASAGIDPESSRLAIRGVDALGAKGDLFLGDGRLFESPQAVLMEVVLPGGSWQMALLPEDPPAMPRMLRLAGSAALFVLFALMNWRLIQSRERMYELNEALTQSESSYRTIANHLSEAVFKTDTEGLIRYISPAAKTLFGQGNLIGCSWAMLFEQSDRIGAQALFEEALTQPGRAFSAVFRVRSADRVRWIEIHAKAPEKKEEAIGLVGTMRDETARIEAQQALEQSRDDLAESQRIARLGSWEIDSRTQMMTLGCEHRRLMQQERTDLPMTILLEHFLKLYVHPDDAPILRAAMERATVSREDPHYRDSFEYRLITGKGEMIFVWANLRRKAGSGTVFVGVTQDISSLKEVQSALLASEMRYRGFIENLSDGVLAIQGGIVCYANAAMARMAGYAIDEIVGTPLEGYVAKEDLPMMRSYHAARLMGQQVPSEYDLRLIRQDKAIRTVRVNASLAQWDGQPAVIATVTDISERKAYENLLLLQKKQHEELLIQQSKMAAMGEMIGAIVHQFKQPLSVLSLIVQELPEEIRAGTLDEAYLQRMQKQALDQIDYMSRTADDFRNFFSPTKHASRFSPLQAVREVESLLQRQLKIDSIALCYDPKNDPCEIGGVYNEFKQVILNLLTNARDAIGHARKRGTLAANEPGEITVSIRRKEGKAEVVICDNGGGIEPGAMERIFEPYFTTKEGKSGTGIGLYMSKTIIESGFDGKIHAANTPKGACFTLEVRSA